MRINIEIDEKKLRSVLRLTKQKKKSPAVAQALDEYVEMKKKQEFVNRVMEGKTDYTATNEEIETQLITPCTLRAVWL